MDEGSANPLDELAELEAADERQHRWALFLLVIPLALMLWPPLFDRDHPTLIGMPFFVWYQLAGVAFGGLVTGLVYYLSGHDR